MAAWSDVPDEIKKRFPAPPERERFGSDDEYREAAGYWQSRVGRNLGMVMQQHNASLQKSIQNAKMLMPKFSCHDENGWHVQWPKDDPHVVRAATQEELIPLLATWLRQLGRFGNEGPHVAAENGCPTCK